MRKKFAVILLAVLAMLAGCAGTVQESARQDEERVKISIAVWDVAECFRGDPVLDAIEEKFNITFEPVNVTWDDHYQKITQWAAMDMLPDLFVGDFRSTPQFIQWVDQGLLHELPEDLSAYPNLERYMEGFTQAQLGAVNGKLYAIPRRTYPSQSWTSIDRIVAYRWDLAQKAGITKEPETWEEFQQMILAIIEADPEGINIQGMVFETPTIISGILLPYASPIAVSVWNSFLWKLDKDGLYRPAYFADDLIPAFQLGREMYQSGVIEKDVLLETTGSAHYKFLRGENAAILYAGGYAGTYSDIACYWNDYHGRDYIEDVKALKLMPDRNGNKAYPIWGYAWSESCISAKASPEEVDRILQLYDYLLSDEGAFFGAYGPEGDLYEVVDGKVQMNDGELYLPNKYPSCSVFSTLVRWSPSMYDDRFVSYYPVGYDEVNREIVREAETVPIPDYEPECSVIVKEEKLDFSIQVGDDFFRIMTGTEPVEDMWAEIRQEYEEKGLQDVIDLVNLKMKNLEN